jgi:predicted O-methyltransferase YrrM
MPVESIVRRRALWISVAAVAAALTFCLAPGVVAQRAQPAPRAPRADMARVLADIKARDKGQLSVSEEDGRFLRVMIAARGAKRVLEIGGASGYSAIWMGSAVKDTGGKVVTIEYDATRAKELVDNVRRAGVADVVQVVAGDAFQQIPKLEGTFDFVFLDAWKKDYKRFFDLAPTTSSTRRTRWRISSRPCINTRPCGRRSCRRREKGCRCR